MDLLIEAILGIGSVIGMFLCGVCVGREFESFQEFVDYFIKRLKPKMVICDNEGCISGEILHIGESDERPSFVDCPVCKGTGEKMI